MRNILIYLVGIPILLLGYQNCGQLSPVHEGTIGQASSANPSGYIPNGQNNYGTDTVAEDLAIQAASTDALVTWGNRCQNCHANRAISSFSQWGDAFFSGMDNTPTITGNKIRFRHGNRTVTMPTNTTLSANEQDSLMVWIDSIVAKKEKIENDVDSCRTNSQSGFAADINPMLSNDMINYDGKTQNCLDCHSGANAPIRLDGTANDRKTKLISLSFPRKPEASILHDTLKPGDGSTPSGYHQIPESEISKVKEWINGCFAD